LSIHRILKIVVINTNMKSAFLVILLGFCRLVTHGQVNTFPANGKVGLGTISPQVLLDIVKPAENNIIESISKFTVSDANGQHFQIKNGTMINGNFIPVLAAERNKSDNPVMILSASVTDATVDIGDKPMLRFDARILSGPTTVRPLFSWGSYYNDYMIMSANGNLGIGTNKPGEKLSVNGKIRAHEIKVETTNWPDYVFKPEYQLTSLSETEQFIKKNGHLPEIPKASEIEANGLSLGEMNKLMMKKIEELTLHLIEEDKEMKGYKQLLVEQADKLKHLEARLK